MTTTQLDMTVPLRACTPWCENRSGGGEGHPDAYPVDRYCTSSFEVVPLSHSRHRAEKYSDGVWRYPWLNVYLRRDHDHDDASVVIHSEETDEELFLTLEEARTLRDHLSGLLETADEG